jgi:hypothetical protein
MQQCNAIRGRKQKKNSVNVKHGGKTDLGDLVIAEQAETLELVLG